MAGEINALISDQALNFPAIVATGSVVAGDFVSAYQTATDDMFALASAPAFTTGSVAIDRTANSTGQLVVGVTLNDADSGETIQVTTQGLFIAKSTGTVTAGFKVRTDGQGIVDYVDSASGAHGIVGRALTGASATDKYVLLRLDI